MRLIYISCLFALGCTEPSRKSAPVLMPDPLPVTIDTAILPKMISRVVYDGQDTVIIEGNFKAISGDTGSALITIRNAKYIRLSGAFDGSGNDYKELIHIEGQGGRLWIDSIRFEGCKYNGMGVFATDIYKQGLDSIIIGKYIERDGIGLGEIKPDGELYGLHIRGGHKYIQVGEIDIKKQNTHWLKQDTLPHSYQFAVTCEVDANNFPRPELVKIGSLNVKYFGGVCLNGVNNIEIGSITKDSLFHFNKNSYLNINLTKFGYSNYRVENSSVKIGSISITNSAPTYQRAGFIIPFWLADFMPTATIDTIKTDMICGLNKAVIKYAELSIPLQKGNSEWMQLHDAKINTLHLTEKNTIYTYIAPTSKVNDVTGNKTSLVK
jgi:hypothetical protein